MITEFSPRSIDLRKDIRKSLSIFTSRTGLSYGRYFWTTIQPVSETKANPTNKITFVPMWNDRAQRCWEPIWVALPAESNTNPTTAKPTGKCTEWFKLP